MKIFIKFLIVLFPFISQANTHSADKSILDSYLESMFTCKYDDTKKILAQLNKDHANNVLTKLAFANFWMVMYETSDEDEKFHILCKDAADSMVKLTNAKEEITKDDVFNLIAAKSILLKIQMNKKQYLKAARDLKNIIKYFEFALKHEDDSKMKLIAGMYNYYIETAKEDYPVAYPLLLFYPSGDKKKGLDMIKECTKDEDKRVSIRSYIYLARIYFKDEKDPIKSAFYYDKLLSMYPENLIWRYEYIQSLNAFNKTEKSKKHRQILSEKVNNNAHLSNEQKKFFLSLSEGE